MLTRRQLFAWIGGAVAAAAALPAIAKSQVAVFKARSPYYLTNLDTPRWFAGYENLEVERVSIVGEMKPVTGDDYGYYKRTLGKHFVVRTDIPNPALDAAIDKAMKGLPSHA